MKRKLVLFCVLTLFALAASSFIGCSNVDGRFRLPDEGDPTPYFGKYLRLHENGRVDSFDFFEFTDRGNYDWRWFRGSGTSVEEIGGRIGIFVEGYGHALVVTKTGFFTGTEDVYVRPLYTDRDRQFSIVENGEQKIYVHEDALLHIKFEDATFNGAKHTRYFTANYQLLPGDDWHNPIPDRIDGRDFEGWCVKNEEHELIPYSFGVLMTQSVILYAKWTPKIRGEYSFVDGPNLSSLPGMEWFQYPWSGWHTMIDCSLSGFSPSELREAGYKKLVIEFYFDIDVTGEIYYQLGGSYSTGEVKRSFWADKRQTYSFSIDLPENGSLSNVTINIRGKKDAPMGHFKIENKRVKVLAEK